MSVLNINELTFGSDDAELDEKHGFLGKVFLKTSIYHRVRNSFRELIIGRKGSGKSAICLMLKNVLESEGVTTILITPDSLSQRKIEQLKISSINKDESYILSWKYILLITVAREILAKVKNGKTKSIKKKLKILRHFLIANSEIEKSFFDRLFGRVSALSKLSVKAYGIEGSLETRQLQIQNDAANELNDFEKVLAELLAELEEFKIALLIDKVDDIWNQTEESEMMIVGLLKAIHALNASLKNVNILVFLRADIYDTLKFNDSDKFHSLEERLNWEDGDLKHLIATRGKVSANLDETGIDTLWNIIFESQVHGTGSFEYIVERTLKRPRDLIQFCNNALTEAQDQAHYCITQNDILKAEKQYSNWKLKDLASEYAIQYSYLDELLGLFQAFKVEFTQEEFDIRYQEAKKTLTKYPELQTISTSKMLQILFIIGFLGTRVNGEEVFVYDDPLTLLPQHNTLVVHPAFHPALGLQKSILFDQRQQKVTGQVNVAGDIIARDVVTGIQIDQYESTGRELDSLKKRLTMLERNLRKLEEQSARYGAGEVPLHILNQIEDAKSQIQEFTERYYQIGYQKIPLDQIANASLTADYYDPPTGEVVFNGVPFLISQDRKGIFNTSALRGKDTVHLKLSKSFKGVTSVYFLINSGNSLKENEGETFGIIKFGFEENIFQQTDLILGKNIREWAPGNLPPGRLADTVIDSLSQPAWVGTNHSGNKAVIDQLEVPIFAENHHKALEQIVVTRNLQVKQAAFMIYAITLKF